MVESYDKPISIHTVKGWLTSDERVLLAELASQLRANAVILNIGTEYGGSVACLRAGNRTAYIHAYDLDMSRVLEGGYGAILHEQDSHQAIKSWLMPLDLIFVDGDHGELGVLMDAKFADFLRVGGHVLFQDCWSWEETGVVHPMVPGVNAAVDKWLVAHKEEFEELPSVDTTRVFRRVKPGEFEKYAKSRVAASGGSYSDI